MADNPYAPPSESKPGVYDHRLRNRILVAILVLAAFFAGLDLWILMRGNLHSDVVEPTEALIQALEAEFGPARK